MRFIEILVPVGALFLFSGTAFAQAQPDAVVREAERLQERELERQRAREQDLLERQQTAPSGQIITQPDVATDGNEQCIAVTKVNIVGMTIYDEVKFASELAKLVSDCTSLGTINEALRVITNTYIEDGYITSRAVVGPQDLNDGVLDITVVEGTLDGIGDAEANGYGDAALDAAFPSRKNGLLNLRDLEQGVDQLARLPSYEAKIDIEPGNLPGTSAVKVARQAVAPILRPSVSANNDGSIATGRIQGNIGLDADNILGVADFWSLYVTRSVEDDRNRGSKGFGGFVSVPYGYWTLSANAGRFEYESVLDANGQSFVSDGDSWNASATLDRLVYRDADTKASVSATLAVTDTENRIQGIRLSTSSFRLATGSVDARLQQRLRRGLLTAGAGITRGLDVLGANAADTGPSGPGLTFTVLDASLGYRQPFQIGNLRVGYSAFARGQTALDAVFSANRFNLGGSSTVRGFRDDGLSGRSGITVRQQAEVPVITTFADNADWEGRLSTYFGYDAGGIFSRGEDSFERGFLHSATLGLRYASRWVSLEFSALRPLSAPAFVERKDVEFAFSARLGI